MDERLMKLEIFFSNQTQALEEMSHEMFQQQKEITGLKLQLEELKEQLDASTNEIGGQERPPHY